MEEELPDFVEITPKTEEIDIDEICLTEVPVENEDDRQIWCDVCQKYDKDYCKKCGILKILVDTPVQMGVENRARKTLPRRKLTIGPSKIHNLGVFAKEDVESGVQMGPYQGLVKNYEETGGYSWMLKNGFLIDASDETQSNWLRYVNCARHMSEQNLVAFQYMGEIYYRTFKKINQGEELLVYYGTSFAEELGVDTERYFEPAEDEAIQDYYKCDHCDLCLASSRFKKSHMNSCKWKFARESDDQPVFQCEHCKTSIMNEDYYYKHINRCSQRGVKSTKPDKPAEDMHCNDCDYKTFRKMDLIRHIFTKHKRDGAVKYLCPHCDYSSVRKSTLNRHLNTHNSSRIFRCTYCQQRSSTLRILYNHVLQKHRQENEEKNLVPINCKIHRCPACPYMSVQKAHFDDHVRGCSRKLPPLQCKHCDYTSTNNPNMRRHVLMHHAKRKPYQCTFCDHAAYQKKTLDQHVLQNHSDHEISKIITCKIHECPHCSFRTVVSSNLHRHIYASH